MNGGQSSQGWIFRAAILGLLAVLTSSNRAFAAPSFGHVFIIVEENHSYEEVVGNPLMPYFNSLINNYASATQYYANQHPSLPNYLWLTSGSNDGIMANACCDVVSTDNVVQELQSAGLSWRTYQQSLPYAGFLGCASGYYHKRADPFAYYSNVVSDVTAQTHIVPLRQFGIDLANHNVARYNLIAPNVCNNMHSNSTCSNGCTSRSRRACFTAADQFLQQKVGALLNTGMFQPGGHGLLIITFDESAKTDVANGGGHVAWVAVSPLAKPGYQSTNFYQHQSTLRLMLEGLGVTTLPNDAATAPDMSEFFN